MPKKQGATMFSYVAKTGVVALLTAGCPSHTAAPRPGAPPCEGSDHRVYGSACCEVTGGPEGNKYPGMIFLSCTGPRIGAACGKKDDCDVVCSCDDPAAPPGPSNGPTGPDDGTTGVTGVCGSTLQMGVWMCEIDEHGVVTHVIVD